MAPVEERPSTSRPARGPYDANHLVFALALGMFTVAVASGFTYSARKNHAPPALSLDPLAQAREYMAHHEPARALRQYRMAAEISPWDPEAARALARALTSVGTSEAQVVAWQTVLALDPRSREASLRLGHALSASGRKHEAEVAFGNALELDPESLEAAMALGDLLLARGELTGALAVYQSCLPGHAGSAALHRALGLAFLQASRPDEAVTELTTAVRLSPTPDQELAASLARAAGAKASRSR